MGTLTYQLSSVLHDSEHDQHPHHHATHKVMVLGIDRHGPPDLLPIPTNSSVGSQGYCSLNAQNELIITVHNQGDVTAGSHLVRISYQGSGGPDHLDLPVPELPAGASFTASTDIAPICSGGSTDCHFSISVDHHDRVLESDESNNAANALCTG